MRWSVETVQQQANETVSRYFHYRPRPLLPLLLLLPAEDVAVDRRRASCFLSSLSDWWLACVLTWPVVASHAM